MKGILLYIVSLWVRSWRVRWKGPPPGEGVVIGLWHQDLPACLAAFRGKGIAVMISQSQDGELFAYVAKRLGYQVFRGSSSRGQGAVRHLLRILGEGTSVGMALDGPRGPAMIAKPGGEWLARQAHAPLARITVRYTKMSRLKSWDRTCLPWPGSRITLSCENTMYDKGEA